MAIEKTLSIIKPDAVSSGFTKGINTLLEEGKLKIIHSKPMHLTAEQASDFYAIHKDRPFFNDLVKYMTSGPIVVQVLEGEDAVAKNREIMGATNPDDALPGTIRHEFGASIEANAVHGSDSLENAATEIKFFFGAI